MNTIEIRGLSKSFGRNKVLSNVSLTIKEGEVVAVIGPSGTGKSTLLRCINLLEKPESGSVVINGVEINLTTKSSKEKLELRKKTEMVFQQFNLFKNRTALENVTEGLTVVKKMKKREAERVALQYLDKVGMGDRLNHYPRHLSGGQQQRVAIARALAMRPTLLLMDEPTSSLDPELVSEVLSTIKKIAEEGNTILLVTHEMNFVKNVASRVVFLENGNVVADGTPREIFYKPENERLKEFLGKMHLTDDPDYFI